MLKKTILTILFSLIFINTPSYATHTPLLKNIDGEIIDFSSLKGKWIFINYWASWCGPCLEEIGEFNNLYDNHADNIAVFGVNFDLISLQQQKIMAKKFKIHYPSLQAESMKDLPIGDISVVPVTFVFNPSGKLETTLYGSQTLKSLEEKIISQELP